MDELRDEAFDLILDKLPSGVAVSADWYDENADKDAAANVFRLVSSRKDSSGSNLVSQSSLNSRRGGHTSYVS